MGNGSEATYYKPRRWPFHIVVVVVALTIRSAESRIEDDPDYNQDIQGLIRNKGYPVETYEVETEDGYLLGLFRIPRGAAGGPSSSRPIALLLHGILESPSYFVINFPSQSLGFILADNGYDVWLLGLRGSTESRKHKTLSTESRKFWDFSWEDQGLKDLPTTIDFILKESGQTKLHLIGHSMGITASLACLSLKPEYNDKVRSLMAFAPSANLSHTTSFIRPILPFKDQLYTFAELTLHGAVFDDSLISKFNKLCRVPFIRKTFCDPLFFFTSGSGREQVNETRIPIYEQHSYTGSSAKQFYHYAQVISAKDFVRFDFGKFRNKKIYGQNKPPPFPVEKISVPVGMFYSDEDTFANPTDVALLRDRLTNVVKFYLVPYTPWSHTDFVMAVDAFKYVYSEMLEVIKMY